ncbi:A-kinase anchor protein 8-like [Acipenser oxyrinchus oxyrinchus]|uniref:A-kinase anchor protein 8-like n=1 Tax=Acipenser oxyrinchus oxyrinchus TaxID=40147 RepID=A0AAD8CP05_ACIOX|nr:A-kinase anchor protein 8-like [Acipenser oxyrinchus oxyrinchus]
MDSRGYKAGYGNSSGYSSWDTGTSNRGSGGGYDSYDYGYGQKDSSGSGSFGGYGMQSKSWELPKQSGLGSSLSSTGTNADAVIAKINQRLDMLSQLEGDTGTLGGGRQVDRFDQYESYDSRSTSLNHRDLYRSAYGYSEGGLDPQRQHRGGSSYAAGRFGNPAPSSSFSSAMPSYGSGHAHSQRPRDNFGQGWPGRSQRGLGGAAGRGFGDRWSEPRTGARGSGSSRGPSPGGKPPSLFSHDMHPEMGAFQKGSPGDRRFGGAAGFGVDRQRVRKRVPTRTKAQKGGKNKRKQTQNSGDAPESKVAKKEESGSKLGNEKTTEEAQSDNGEAKPKAEGEGTADGEDALTMQEEINQIKLKLQASKQTQEKQKRRQRSRLIERVQYACSVCKFRSYYDEDMKSHLESKFHKDHFKFLATKLSSPTAAFLQQYLLNKSKRTEERRGHIDNISAAITQIYKEQDLTRDIGMEHFVRKVEAAHCAACDLFIPMQLGLIQKHLKSHEHNLNRKGMMEQSKRASMSVARSILNHKVICKKLDQYLKGENPFVYDPNSKEDQEEEGGENAEGGDLNDSLGEGEQENAEGGDLNDSLLEGGEENAEGGDLNDSLLEGGEENVEGGDLNDSLLEEEQQNAEGGDMNESVVEGEHGNGEQEVKEEQEQQGERAAAAEKEGGDPQTAEMQEEELGMELGEEEGIPVDEEGGDANKIEEPAVE